MVLEVTAFTVRPEEINAFESRFRRASGILARVPGYVRHELHKCVETDGKYLMFVQWASISHHAAGFRRSPAYAQWRAQLDPLLDAEPQTEHYVSIRVR